MRNGLKILVAVAFAASMAACDTAGDDVEIYEGEEAATPSMETPAQPGADIPVMMAQFETAETAPEGTQVTGTARVFRADGAAGTTGATGATADRPTTDRPGQTGETTGTGQTQTNQANGFRVEVSLNGLAQGEHAWHIHSGPCGEQAPVEVAFSPTSDKEGLTNALNADQSGRAEGSATVPADQLTLDRLQSGDYSLHVHTRGGVDHGPTVACANLEGQGTTTTM